MLGIELGGDDYVVKPFSPREVVARVERDPRSAAAARRAEAGAAAPGQPQPAAPRSGRLGGALGRRAVPLTVTEFQLLLLLAGLPAKVFSRDAIIDRLHGPGFADHRPHHRQPHPQPARQIRRRWAAADLIETRAGIGYRIGPCRGAPA